MRLDNSDEKVIEFYDLYFDPDDPGMTEPVDLCDNCSVGWSEELFIDTPPDQIVFICFECGREIQVTE